MKKLVIIFWGICSLLMAETVEDYLSNSKTSVQSGNLVEAISILEEGIKNYKDSADLYAEYGLYISQRAGQVNFLKAGMLSEKAFTQFSKALKLDESHINARLYRGILSVNVPKFMGKLNQGIEDLEYIQKKQSDNQQLYLVSTFYLGMGYEKKNELKKAKDAFKYIVIYAKDSGYYDDAKRMYEKLLEKDLSIGEQDYYNEAQKFLAENKIEEALSSFSNAIKQNPNNLEIHLIYARTLGQQASMGYDSSIKEDVTARAELAHNVFEVLSKCVELAPDNNEILFLRGSVAINLPFFVNSLETGIKDLTYLKENGETAELKAKSSFLLAQAQQMLQVNIMAKKGYNAKTEDEKVKLLPQFITTTSPINQQKPTGDYLQIDMTLGYRDQIAPQTVVWIEDEDGNYIKTIYISGFAASVKEAQIHLPIWAKSSEFRNIEAVTGASIDCGKHLFYWDFTDFSGNEYKVKEFVVRTEICHWPHVQYFRQKLDIDLDKDEIFISNENNFLIPNLIVSAKTNR